jgi:hypothetical protein
MVIDVVAPESICIFLCFIILNQPNRNYGVLFQREIIRRRGRDKYTEPIVTKKEEGITVRS